MKVAEAQNLYHLFPDFSCSQDSHASLLLNKYRIQSRYIPQKDGSRLKCIYSEKMHPSGIIESLKRMYGESIPIFREVNQKEFIWNNSDCEFFIVHTHSFLDSVRVIPIVANYKFSIFWNVSKLWPQYIPEDYLGILLPSLSDVSKLQVGAFGQPTHVVEYLADKRVCIGCGRVVDYSVPIPPLNWQSKQNQKSYHQSYKPKAYSEKKRGRPRKVRD